MAGLRSGHADIPCFRPSNPIMSPTPVRDELPKSTFHRMLQCTVGVRSGSVTDAPACPRRRQLSPKAAMPGFGRAADVLLSGGEASRSLAAGRRGRLDGKGERRGPRIVTGNTYSRSQSATPAAPSHATRGRWPTPCRVADCRARQAACAAPAARLAARATTIAPCRRQAMRARPSKSGWLLLSKVLRFTFRRYWRISSSLGMVLLLTL
jgi:hypothetical protein